MKPITVDVLQELANDLEYGKISLLDAGSKIMALHRQRRHGNQQ